MVSPLEIFCCYARKDQSLLKELKIHLSPLQRRGLITIWSDIDINAGAEWEEEIKKHLNTAQIILLLISPDFMASEYCYSTEMQRALKRHEQKEAHVIPILLRPTSWKGAPFDKLQVLPTNAKPVMDRRSWLSEDEALNDVAEGIQIVVEGISKSSLHKTFQPAKVERSNQSSQYKVGEHSHAKNVATTEEQFHQAMINLYHETYQAIHYRASQFYRMVNENGGVETAHRLIAKESTEGFTKLWEKGRLDLSIEALILKPEFATLFTEAERKKARERLAEYRYQAPWDIHKAVQNRKTKEEWLKEGDTQHKAGHYEEALFAYEQALQIDENLVSAWAGKGEALRGCKLFEEARAAFERAIWLDSENASLYVRKGDALNDVKNYTEALAAYEKAIELDSNHMWAWQNKALVLVRLAQRTPEKAELFNHLAQQAFEKARQLGYRG